MKKLQVLRVAARRPRNRFAVLARRLMAGAHKGAHLERRGQEMDLVQQLREAGLL